MKNKIIFMLICCFALWSGTALRAEDIFNPENPGDPQSGLLKYSLNVSVTPQQGGETNFITSKNRAGSDIYLSADNNTNYIFKHWQIGDSIVSTYSSFYYIMPQHDVDIVAVFEPYFNPDSPEDPQVGLKKYNLTIVTTPENGGYTNYTFWKGGEHDRVYLEASPNINYAFVHWLIGDSVVSYNGWFEYEMPAKDVMLTAVFKPYFNPQSPADPNTNYWNATTGEVIIDKFESGDLRGAIDRRVDNLDQITMLTVAGEMSFYDFGAVNNYDNCILFDLSRTFGYTSIPNYAFEYNSSLQKVILPSTVEKIGYDAFYNCSNLNELHLYATTPPDISDNTFYGTASAMVVKVLPVAIPLYTQHEKWGKFTILPLDEEVRTINVNFSEKIKLDKYKNSFLELLNLATGQRYKYILSGRDFYSFSGLITDVTYSVSLKNQKGVVLGEIKNIALADKDTTVVFDSLLVPQTISLSVVTPQQVDVTSQIQVSWFDVDGEFIKRATSVDGYIEGDELRYSIVLDKDLSLQYKNPVDAKYVVNNEDNSIVVELESFEVVRLKGVVKDSLNNMVVPNAAISVSQQLNSKYIKSFIANTNSKGEFVIDVFDVHSNFTISANEYISRKLEYANFGADSVDLGVLKIKSITGAIINLNFTYTNSVVSGGDAVVQDYYSDYNNISYTIYNKTQQKAITEFSDQCPKIVLLEEVNEGDVLELIASSRKNSFKPVVAEATISDDKANVRFDIVQLGGIKATYVATENIAVIGILYDSKGELIKKYEYNNFSLVINELQDGNYTLVSMGKSVLFNDMSNLASFANVGLIEGTDYIVNDVVVSSGVLSIVSNENVPKFDESKLYYTGVNTTFGVNKTSITAGNYLTLRAKIDFKNEFVNSVDNLNLVIDLPESILFVENSVMVGNAVASYTVDGHRLIIPVGINDLVRFCIIPTASGNYAPTAFAQFDIEGKTVMQPIGSANFLVKDLTITVPSVVAKTTIPVSGTAIGKSNIEIYDRGVLIGQTTSLANGLWATTCELKEPYNLSMHNIYAKVLNASGIELQSEIKQCLYDVNAIQVSKVTMYHFNPEMNGWRGTTYKSVFDFMNPSSKPNTWTVYYPEKKFTYTLEFTNNSPEVVSNVVLYVHTADGRIVSLRPTYDANKDLWIADIDMGSSSDGYYPVNVSVDFDCPSLVKIDSDYLNLTRESFLNFVDDNLIWNYRIDSLSSLIDVELGKDSVNDSVISDLLFELTQDSVIIDEKEVDSLLLLSDEEFEIQLNQVLSYVSSLQLTSDLIFDSICLIADDLLSDQIDTIYWDNIVYVRSQTSCSGLDIENLLASGYELVPSIGEGVFLEYLNDTIFDFIDFSNDRRVLIREIMNNVNMMKVSTRNDGWLESISNMSRKLVLKLSENEDILAKGYNVFKEKQKEELLVINICEEALDNQLNAVNKKLSTAFGLKKVDLELKKKDIQKSLKKLKKEKAKVMKLPNSVARVNLALDLISEWGKWHQRVMEYANRIDRLVVPSCSWESEPKAAALLEGYIQNIRNEFSSYFKKQFGRKLFYTISDMALGKLPWLGYALGILEDEAERIRDEQFDRYVGGDIERYEKYVQQLKEKCAKDDDNSNEEEDDNNDEDGGEYKSGQPDDEVQIDPSGYVYEGVSSNRIEGVMASCYYKETVEDMFGDKHENIVLWDAENYAQENPLFTDENGMYRWDVPQGMWQVKFEKDGYQTIYSDWLPVPPPQLEVNIAMVQNSQPEVVNVRAYENGIEIDFDKYMNIETLNNTNIVVVKNNESVEGNIVLLNEEQVYTNNTITYASKVRFNPSVAFLTTDEIILTISKKVKSYANIQMAEDYTQSFSITKEVDSIVVDSLTLVDYGLVKDIIVSILPFDAAIGKKLIVSSTSSMIASVVNDTVVIDEEGKAVVSVVGELPGIASVKFVVENVTREASSIVNVVYTERESSIIVNKPQASVISGAQVAYGTAVSLSCETENVVIYYTIDGSSPSDSNRLLYSAPIVIEKDVVIKAIAVLDSIESTIAEFVYTIKPYSVDVNAEYGEVLGGGLYMHGDTIMLKAVANEGYHFVQWSDGVTDSVRSVVVLSDSVFIAEFAINVYVVTVKAEYGEISGGGSYTHGDTITLKAVANEGYHFVKWSDGVTDTIRSVIVLSDSTFTAEFEANKYTVVVSAGEGGVVTGGGEYEYGDTVTLIATANKGYQFVRWSDGVTHSTRLLKVESDTTLFAEFEVKIVKIYSVTLEAKHGKVIGAGAYEEGTEITIEAIANEGYHFVKWSDDVTDVKRVIVVSSDTVLTAIFAINVYNLTINVEHGTAIGAGEYEYATEVQVKVNPDKGYHFVRWSDGETSSTRYIVVVSDTILTAEMAIDRFVVTLSGENGEVIGAGEYDYGTTVTIEAKADEGYHFVEWSDGVKDAIRDIEVTSNIDLVAKFAVNMYMVILNAENGVVIGAGEYAYGTEVTIIAMPNTGYKFVRWSDGDTLATRQIVVKENIELTAEFIVIETALDDVDYSNIEVYVNNGVIYIIGVEENYCLFDSTGKLVYKGSNSQVALPRGIYILQVGNYMQKIAL